MHALVARRCAARAAVSRVLAARRRVPGGLRASYDPVRQAAPACHAPSSLRPAQLASVSRTGDIVHNKKKKAIYCLLQINFLTESFPLTPYSSHQACPSSRPLHCSLTSLRGGRRTACASRRRARGAACAVPAVPAVPASRAWRTGARRARPRRWRCRSAR